MQPSGNPKKWKITPLSKKWIRRSDNCAELNQVIDNPNCTFLGGLSDQPFTAFYVWEKFFLKYGSQMERFIEFGLDMGNTGCYFLLQCINHHAQYIGYDRKHKATYNNTPVKRLIKLQKKVRIGNGYKMLDDIRGHVRSKGMSVIFSDCIDKPYEFRNFAPMLKRGDVLAMHDWDRAVKDEWVKESLELLKPFKLLYEKERLGINTLTRFFLKE